MSEVDDLTDAARLAALHETGLLDALPQASLDRFTRIASLSIGAPVALVSLVDDRRQFFSSLTGLPDPWASARETPLTHSFCKLVVAKREALVVTDARADTRVADNLAIRDLGVIAYAGAPIRTPDAHVLGSFCVIDGKPRAWSERELALLDELAAAVSDEVALRRRAELMVRSERALAQLNQELAEAHDSSTLASRQAVHDMRTPLGVLAMGIARLRQHEAVRAYPEIERMLDRLGRNSSHAAALLEGLESTRKSVPPGPGVRADLAALACEVARDLGMHHASIEFAGASRGGWVSVEESELRRCIENVVSNAVRFARKRVRITAELSDREALLHVDDDGEGLPTPEAYEQVWGRDVRYHVESGRSGSGLGLSIVREIVARAGGRSYATPSPLGGAHFTLALRRA